MRSYPFFFLVTQVKPFMGTRLPRGGQVMSDSSDLLGAPDLPTKTPATADNAGAWRDLISSITTATPPAKTLTRLPHEAPAQTVRRERQTAQAGPAGQRVTSATPRPPGCYGGWGRSSNLPAPWRGKPGPPWAVPASASSSSPLLQDYSPGGGGTTAGQGSPKGGRPPQEGRQ